MGSYLIFFPPSGIVLWIFCQINKYRPTSALKAEEYFIIWMSQFFIRLC